MRAVVIHEPGASRRSALRPLGYLLLGPAATFTAGMSRRRSRAERERAPFWGREVRPHGRPALGAPHRPVALGAPRRPVALAAPRRPVALAARAARAR